MATVLVVPRTISLSAGNPTFQSARIAVPALTTALTVALARPTTAVPRAWTTAGTVRVTLAMVVDGQECRVVGQATGGIRLTETGAEAAEYRLTLTPTQRRGKRYGEDALTERTAYLVIERLRGTIDTALTLCEASEAG